MKRGWIKGLLVLAVGSNVHLPAWGQDSDVGRLAIAGLNNLRRSDVSIHKGNTLGAFEVTVNGPLDPTNPSLPLFCNPQVQRQFGLAFMKTRNGEDRMGLAEAGRSIELRAGSIAFGPWSTTDSDDGEIGERANRMNLTTTAVTVAVFHTHGNGARPVPSARDLEGSVPDFVISQSAVFVTIPGTHSYLRLNPSVCRLEASR